MHHFAPVSDWRSQPGAFLRHLFEVAVASATPLQALQGHLPAPPKGKTVVIGAGKAAAAMAQAVEALWPAEAPLEGVVVTRYDHVPPRPAGLRAAIQVLEARHPVPDAAGVAASQAILNAVQGLTTDDLVLCLISGGGSALLSLPTPGLSLQDKQHINQQLLDSGAGIGEMNCVRKHLSAIKGGRLALACMPAQLVTLGISDVPGDDASTIASGPTVADETTCAEALAIIDRLGIDIPPVVRAGLADGQLETPKADHACFARSRFALIATPKQALEAAAQAAWRAGITAHVLSDDMEGESRVVGQAQALLARDIALHHAPFAPPCVLLSGGETTVTVDPALPKNQRGRGGRAGEFGLGLAQALGGEPRIWGLAADTDGIDGVENNAGVLVTPDTLARAAAQGRDVADALRRHDAWGFFHAVDDLVITGPTFTNVNDFRAILIV